jgi:4-hydroxyacetophenone monooxygenase
LYSYSFHQKRDWPQRFTPQAGLLDYFRETSDRFGLREHIRFGTEVVHARFRDDTHDWEVHLRSAAGDEVLRAAVVVSAVGQLNRPRLPDIRGRERFAGAAFHSARWDSSVDLRGKRVAVVGTAASGFQVIPPIAEQVAELHVYQRTANWFAPTRDYHGDTPDGMQWLLDNVPTYSEWYRLSLFWRQSEGILAAARPGRRNDEFRAFLTSYLAEQFGDRPDLLPQVVPAYPPLAKRILLDDGIWAATLRRPNVELVTDAIDEITDDGIVAGGQLRPVDVIVYATGFHASEFLMPMQVTGRDGVDLHDRWGGDARAYLGMTIPGFPNLFCMYGPNTNLVANGSIIYLSECEVQYVLSAIELLLRRRARSLEVRRDVHDAYNFSVDEANNEMVWGASHVNTWYRNAHGRIAQNWPFTLLVFWQRTRAVNPDDYVIS